MFPSAFDEETCVLDNPPGLGVEECEPLSAWRGKIEGGMPAVISCWKPTAEELEEIRRTGRIWITIYGESMPPIYPSGFKPFVR